MAQTPPAKRRKVEEPEGGSVVIRRGDLLRSDASWIVHQGNCLTTRSHGLSRTIAAKHKWADVYSDRNRQVGASNLAVWADRSEPGTVEIRRDPTGACKYGVIMLMGQWSCGKPGRYYTHLGVSDTHKDRVRWFREALEIAIDQVSPDDRRIDFPYRIGCGLAGGNWSVYHEMIKDWAAKHGKDVTIWRQ
jgi:hypothetical protein